MNAVDTNVLLYIHDPRDQRKQLVADRLVPSIPDAALLWKVASQYLSASPKLAPFGYNRDMAWLDLRMLRQVWTLVLPTWDAIDRAERLLGRFSLSFWDALLMASCLESGVNKLYSEDLTSYPRVDTLEIVNPFAVP